MIDIFRQKREAIFVAILLIGAAIASRFIFAEIPNFKPVAALSLLSGMFFHRRSFAIAIPILAMLISDMAIGFAEPLLVVSIYGCLIANVWIGQKLLATWNQQSSLVKRIGLSFGAVAVSSLQFFVVTNFSVWAFTNWYPKTLTGLAECMANGIPFWRFSAAGDFLFGLIPLTAVAVVLEIVNRQLAHKKTRIIQDACL